LIFLLPCQDIQVKISLVCRHVIILLHGTMNDPVIRSAFHCSILKPAHNDRNTLVIDELGLKNGIVRADIAVLNGKLVGYEIKGEKDSLTRLLPQVAAYSEVFENSYIIAAEKHLAKVEHHVPEWWGIYAISPDEHGAPCFAIKRKAEANPARNNFGIAQLLWKAEVSDILAGNYGVKIKQSYTRQHLYQMLAEACDTVNLASIVLKYLKQREGWRTDH